MRHAEAVSAMEWRKSDADRPLTKAGLAKLEAGLKEIKRVGFSVPLVVSSPYLRAQQTADAFCKILNLPPPVIRDELSSGTHNNVLRKIALEYMGQSPVMLVGHMPELATFGSRITFEPTVLDPGLSPADILAIDPGPLEKEWGQGKLLWWRKIDDWQNQ